MIGTVAVDSDGVVSVPVAFESNVGNVTAKTYYGTINSDSKFVEGDAKVTITQKADSSLTPQQSAGAFKAEFDDIFTLEPANVGLSHKSRIEALRAGYDSLAAEVKAILEGETLDNKIAALEAALAALEGGGNPPPTGTGRLTEYLDRGVVAINTGSAIFVSWRLLATEPQDIGFNLYRVTDGAAAVKVNT
jgi:hypothetical protein